MPVLAQTIPQTPAEVASPGGKIPGTPKLALVKVADGFNDPVGVSVADDGSGRIFVVERVGRSKSSCQDGKVLPEPFLDLTKINPLGSDVQTGFVEQGLWSIAFHPKFKDNGYVFVHYCVAAVQRRLDRCALYGRQGEPRRDHQPTANKIGQGAS